MSQVVQAKCPHCQSILRIPTDWVYQPMRCKQCGQVFQVKQRPAAPPPAPARVPVASAAVLAAAPRRAPAPVAAPAPTANGSPFAFNGKSPSGPRRRRPKNWLKRIVLSVAVLALAGVIGVVLGPYIADQFQQAPPDKGKKDGEQVKQKSPDKTKQVAELKPPKVDSPPSKKQPDDPPKMTPQVTPKETPKGPRRPKKIEDDLPPKIEVPKVLPKKVPPKTEPPKKEPPRKEPPKKGPVGKTPPGSEGFPHRALFVSVNDYILANPLHYGTAAQPRFPGSSTGALEKLFNAAPMRFPASQMVQLSDGGIDPHPPLKAVIERTIADFVNTSRAQDRIVLLFAGHAVEDEKEAYLVPIEGDLTNPKTLIPLSWVYDRLKECKARQKVLILDVCRIDPARGQERPGSDAMGKLLDSKLLAPPEGVQVISSCVAGEQSYELASGSAFLQALCIVHQDLKKVTRQDAGSSIPLDTMVKLVNAELIRLIGPLNKSQTVRLTGKEKEGGAPPNPEEPWQTVSIFPPAAVGGDAAPMAEVKGIIDELNLVPPTRVSRNGAKDTKLALTSLPAFSAKALEDFKADYESLDDIVKDEKKYPLRVAIINAAKALRENATKFAMRETFAGITNAQVKTQIKNEQTAPGKAELYLKDALEELKKAGEKRKAEPSKRWQANYDYVLARLLARLVYVTEYNFALAQIRTDNLPEPPAGKQAKYRLGSRKKVSVTEGFAKDWVKEMKKTWDRIATRYPDTPWAIVAQRERMTVLGLEWRPAKE